MHITKMQGLGNSQILIEDLKGRLEGKAGLTYGQIARSLCDQNFGIGSDQVLIIGESEDADYSMRVFNADGGEAEMCGNGIRCVMRYLYDRDKVGRESTIETEAGIKRLEISFEDEKPSINVDMGFGKILEEDKSVGGFTGSFVSIGNPHFVIFSDEASTELASEKGPNLENSNEFQSERTNVEFARISDDDEIETFVWERGAGLTLACGTGACATAFVAKQKGLVGNEIKIKLLGGTLKITIDENGRISMEGSAEYILDGEIPDIWNIHSNLESNDSNYNS